MYYKRNNVVILHFITTFSPLSETFIYDTITELEDQGIDNNVLTFKRVNNLGRPFDKVEIIKEDNFLIHKTLLTLSKVTGNHYLSWLNIQNRIKKVILKIKPDILHAHFGTNGLLLKNIASNMNLPMVTSFHGFDASKLLKQDFYRKNLPLLSKGNFIVTVVSDNMKNKLINANFNEQRIFKIHVGKDLKNYTYTNSEGQVSKFISIGRLTEKKGFDDLISAFVLAHKKCNKISLVIVGEGEQYEYLNEMIKNLGAENYIKLIGSLTHKEVIIRMQNSDAFILTSKTASDGDSEGIPTVLMEAQALGLPVISTHHSGIPEVIPIENQKYLAEEGNIDQIKDCIIKLINTSLTERNFMREIGRIKIQEEFNLKKEASKLIKIYTTLL